MKKEYSKRFEDAPWMLEKMPYANLFGCGSIGSWTALYLSRLGMPLTIVDMDKVEESNIGGQLFHEDDIGYSKPAALYTTCKKLGGRALRLLEAKVTEEFFLYSGIDFDIPVWISAFDNMEARILLFKKWKELAREEEIEKPAKVEGMPPEQVVIVPVFIDGRLTAETLQVFTVTTREQQERFEKEHLFPDTDVEELPCSFKSTSHCAGMIGAIITGLLTNHITNCIEKREVREVPFYTEMSIPLMMLNIIR